MRKAKFVLALVSGLALPFGVFAAGLDQPNPVTDNPSADNPSPDASPPVRGAQGRTAPSLFQQLDTNKDGYIDAKEAEKSATAKANFKAMDTDKDSRISVEEWMKGDGR